MESHFAAIRQIDVLQFSPFPNNDNELRRNLVAGFPGTDRACRICDGDSGLSKPTNPFEREDAMTIRALTIILGISCLGGYVTTSLNSHGPVSSPGVPKASDVPVEVAALAGTWEGFRPDDLPTRLVVEEIRGRVATVRYTWGDQPEGTFHSGWDRVRAVVRSDGTLFWRRPGDFTFQLSDDWTTLVGKRERGGATATSLMRRVSTGAAPSTANAAQALLAPREGYATNALMTMVGWGLFYWMVCLYVYWVLAERTFFAGSDPERWDPCPQIRTASSAWDDYRSAPHLPNISTLGRPA
jgi:hypothetical protein